jgi:hypothetical protein
MTNPTMSYDYEYIKTFLHDENAVFEWDLHRMLADEMWMTMTWIGQSHWTPVQSRFSREWAIMSNNWVDVIGNRRERAYTWDDVGAVFEGVDKDVLMRYVCDENKNLRDRKDVARMLVCWQRWSDEME